MKENRGAGRQRGPALRVLLAAALLALNLAAAALLPALMGAYAAIPWLALQLAGLAAALAVQGRDTGWGDRTGWTILVLGFPLAGVTLYLLRRFAGGRPQAAQSAPPPPHKDYEHSRSQDYVRRLEEGFPAWGREARLLLKNGFMLYKNTAVTYFSTGEELFGDALVRLEQAEHFIFLEFFTVAEGKLWDRVYAALRDRASRGVEVKLLVDGLGSAGRLSAQMAGALRQCGVEVLVWAPLSRNSLAAGGGCRDRRRILCVDGDFAYTGGADLADECAGITKRLGHWRAGGCLLEGEGAWGLTRQFIRLWQDLGGELQNEHDYYRPHGPARGEGWCQPFSAGPEDARRGLAEEVYLQAAASARNFLYIATPRLDMGEAMTRALCAAADSAVAVHVLLPGSFESRSADLAAGAAYEELLSHGVRVFAYTPGFLGSRVLAADGEMAVVGTLELDSRVLRLHRTCGAVLYAMPAVEHILRDMEEAAAQSREITLDKWRRRSVFRRLGERILESFTIWM